MLHLLLLSISLSAAPQGTSNTLSFKAPAGSLPASQHVVIDGVDAAVLPNGRLVTPVGEEVSVGAPKPYGMALSPDGSTLATVNSGSGPFSVTLIRHLTSATPSTTVINLDATFMGIKFSKDGSRFYVAGGEDGVIWVGDTAGATITALVNLNTSLHPITGPVDPAATPPGQFKGAFPGNLTLSPDGRFLYVVDQGSFSVFVVDTSKIDLAAHGIGASDPNNFQAVAGSVKAGRYPFGITASPDGKELLVGNVGMFQYTHLTPKNPVGDNNVDYPLAYPGAGYPEETATDRTIEIKKLDPRNLPPTLRIPDGIRAGYIPHDLTYTVPGLGNPNAPQSSSVYVLNVNKQPALPSLKKIIKTGPLVGQTENGIAAYSGSHPNAIVVGSSAIYVSNGNNDSVSVLDRRTFQELGRINLSVLSGFDGRLKGVQPVALALSPDERSLYVAEAGINAVGVVALSGNTGAVQGHIPTGWWPAAIEVSANARRSTSRTLAGAARQPIRKTCRRNTPPSDRSA